MEIRLSGFVYGVHGSDVSERWQGFMLLRGPIQLMRGCDESKRMHRLRASSEYLRVRIECSQREHVDEAVLRRTCAARFGSAKRTAGRAD